MSRRNVPTYMLTDHLCRHCGTGRVMQQTNSGPTGGGNPVYRCASCGSGSAASGPGVICWCGQIVTRGGLPYETMCVVGDHPAKEFVQRGWYRRMLHYGLSVWWRYSPEHSARNPDFDCAERFLTGNLNVTADKSCTRQVTLREFTVSNLTGTVWGEFPVFASFPTGRKIVVEVPE